MKDLSAIAAKYSTRRKYTCKVCDLDKTKLQIVRDLRKLEAMSYRGISRAMQGEFGVSMNETTLLNHFSKHEAA